MQFSGASASSAIDGDEASSIGLHRSHHHHHHHHHHRHHLRQQQHRHVSSPGPQQPDSLNQQSATSASSRPRVSSAGSRTPSSRVQQLRAQEAQASTSARELAHEQLFSANLSVACAWDSLSLSSSSESSDPQPALLASPSSFPTAGRKRKLSSPLFVACDFSSTAAVAAAAAATASAAVTAAAASVASSTAADKQCFSPSLQSPLTPPAAKRPCLHPYGFSDDRSADSSPVSGSGGGGGSGWSPLRSSRSRRSLSGLVTPIRRRTISVAFAASVLRRPSPPPPTPQPPPSAALMEATPEESGDFDS